MSRLVLVFVLPIGIANLGWKMYMINAGWDILYIVFIVGSSCSAKLIAQALFWVETKGLTLEEVDVLFEGEKHSDVPNIERIIQGKENVDVRVMEAELQRDGVKI